MIEFLLIFLHKQHRKIIKLSMIIIFIAQRQNISYNDDHSHLINPKNTRNIYL